MKSGDLTEEQAKSAEKEAAVQPREATNEKIVFKKPTKTEKTDESKDSTEKKKKSTAKKIKNKSLLSFGEEDDEDS